jgi:hypothetical protein
MRAITSKHCNEVLLYMTDRIGEMPGEMLKKWPEIDKFYDSAGKSRCENTYMDVAQHCEIGRPLDDRYYRQLPIEQSLTTALKYDIKTRSVSFKERELQMTSKEISDLKELLKAMLIYDPKQRIQAERMLEYAWVTKTSSGRDLFERT